jgi:hypothetical protein
MDEMMQVYKYIARRLLFSSPFSLIPHIGHSCSIICIRFLHTFAFIRSLYLSYTQDAVQRPSRIVSLRRRCRRNA